MKCVRFFCLFVILIGILVVLAQSSRDPFGNQPTSITHAQKPRPGAPPSTLDLPKQEVDNIPAI
ncbi:MAG TPA: hypothetical protein VN950_03275 [Terriglobales bacterium]|nr:hypothetical protein [Terriglobales bacterium]